MNERQFNQRVIPLVPVPPTAPAPLTDAERRAAEVVLAMAYNTIDSAYRIVDRLRAKLGYEPDDRSVNRD